MPSLFCLFFCCTVPLDPSSKSTTLRWHFPLCVVYLHPTPLRWDLGVWPIRTTSADSFAVWLPVGFIQWEALAGDPRVQRKCQEGICSASLWGPAIDCLWQPSQSCHSIFPTQLLSQLWVSRPSLCHSNLGVVRALSCWQPGGIAHPNLLRMFSAVRYL